MDRPFRKIVTRYRRFSVATCRLFGSCTPVRYSVLTLGGQTLTLGGETLTIGT